MAEAKEQERRSRKLFIGGVSFSTNDEDFFKYFAKYGELEDCVLIREKDTGQSRGFGFVLLLFLYHILALNQLLKIN